MIKINLIKKTSKICSKCGIEKDLNEFYKDKKTRDGYYCSCKECVKIYQQSEEYQKSLKNRQNSEDYKIYHKKYKQTEGYKQYSKEYNKKYKSSEKHKQIERDRLKYDHCFKLRKTISKKINFALKSQNSSKNGSSILKYLPYSMDELRNHLESQFNEFMTWENHGSYWHIDHIYPQSLLPYDSMEHENFLKCWDLLNLRPLEKHENMSKSNSIPSITIIPQIILKDLK